MKDRHRTGGGHGRRRIDRRRHGSDRAWSRIGDESLPSSVVAAIAAATRDLDTPAGWPSAAPRVLPVLKRAHQVFPPEAAPVLITVPPGIRTGFGIDLGPAFGHVSETLLGTWGVDRATLLGTALENLRRAAVAAPPQVHRFPFEGHEIIGIQGEGWGSSLVLLPDVLGPILGRTPRVLMTPVRNTIIALDEEIDASLAIGIWHALADGAPDELDVDPLRWTGSIVIALADEVVGRPN